MLEGPFGQRKMAEFKNQHYVPQSYLRGFIDLSFIPKNYSKDALWSINKSTNKIKLKGIINICSQNYFYSYYIDDHVFNHDIEHLLGKYETRFSELLEKCKEVRKAILSGIKFNKIRNIEKSFISEYILFQYFRVPSFSFDYISKTIPGFHEMNKNDGVIQTEEQVINDIKKYGFKSMFNYESESFIDLKKIILSKNMVVSIIPDDFEMDFITTDAPVLISNPTGPNALLSINTEITLPITNKFAISFVGNKSNDYYSIIEDKQKILKFNKSLQKKSFEYSFSGNPDRLSELI